MLPDFTFLGRTIGTYGLCSIVGIMVCVTVATLLGKRFQYAFEDVLLITLSACGGLIVGSHIVYGISRIDDVIITISAIGKAPFSLIIQSFIQCFGGMVFYGGFIGGVAGLLIYAKFSQNVDKDYAMDLYAVMTPLFHVFGRIGCFLGGCCYGKEWSWGVVYPENKLSPELSGVVRLPIQLIESGCNLLIFLFILVLFIRKKYEKRLIFVYLLTYPVVRFFLEFFRGDDIRGIFFGLSTSQWISMILFVYAVVYIIVKKAKNQKTENRLSKE